MDFSEALIALKKGESVYREHWTATQWIFQVSDDPAMIYWSFQKGHYVPTYEDTEAKDWGVVE